MSALRNRIEKDKCKQGIFYHRTLKSTIWSVISGKLSGAGRWGRRERERERERMRASCKSLLDLTWPMGRYLILSETFLEIEQKRGEVFMRHSTWISKVVTITGCADSH